MAAKNKKVMEKSEDLVKKNKELVKKNKEVMDKDKEIKRPLPNLRKCGSRKYCMHSFHEYKERFRWFCRL